MTKEGSCNLYVHIDFSELLHLSFVLTEFKPDHPRLGELVHLLPAHYPAPRGRHPARGGRGGLGGRGGRVGVGHAYYGAGVAQARGGTGGGLQRNRPNQNKSILSDKKNVYRERNDCVEGEAHSLALNKEGSDLKCSAENLEHFFVLHFSGIK